MKRPLTIAVSLGCVLVFALGVLAFVLAMRPCRLTFTPGMLVHYRLVTTTNALDQQGAPGPSQVEVRELQLVGTGGDNEAALISPATDGDARHDQVCLLDFSPDGAAFHLDAGARPQDLGVAIGFFDFNLMPLPEAAEQPRDVTINYAIIPAARNPVQGRVRRTKSGAKPSFQLKLQQSVEWVTNGTYHQICDLVSSYRFNTALGVVDKANIDLIAGIEGEQVHKYRISMTLELDGPIGHTREDPRHLREQVLASAQAQDLLHSPDHGRGAEVAEKLRTADIALPQLRTMADHLCQALLNPVVEPESSWSLVVAQGSLTDQASAEHLQRQLQASGFPSRLYHPPGGNELMVLVGPYHARDPGVLSSLLHGFPQFRPAWVPSP